jgi:hypothetical protein
MYSSLGLRCLRLVQAETRNIFIMLWNMPCWLSRLLSYSDSSLRSSSRSPRVFAPRLISSLVSLLFVGIRNGKKVTTEMLSPVIEERRKMMQDPDYKKPVDFLQWLMDFAQGDEQRTGHLCARIQVLNFASIHTTSIALTPHVSSLLTHRLSQMSCTNLLCTRNICRKSEPRLKILWRQKGGQKQVS